MGFFDPQADAPSLAKPSRPRISPAAQTLPAAPAQASGRPRIKAVEHLPPPEKLAHAHGWTENTHDQGLSREEATANYPLLPGCRGRVLFINPGPHWRGCIPPPDMKLRLELWRDWGPNDGPQNPYVMFVGMNPAKADAYRDDHTVRCYIEFAKRLGFTSLLALNICPIVSPDPAFLYKPECEPWIINGPNQTRIGSTIPYANKVVFCFGTLPLRTSMRGEAERLSRVMQIANDKVYCYGVTKDGSPRHLSRLAYDTPLQRWEGFLK